VRGWCARLAGAEELPRLGHRHREHLADVPAAEVVFQHRRLEPLSLALLTGGGDAGHHRQVGVDDTGAVAVRAAPSENVVHQRLHHGADLVGSQIRRRQREDPRSKREQPFISDNEA